MYIVGKELLRFFATAMPAVLLEDFAGLMVRLFA